MHVIDTNYLLYVLLNGVYSQYKCVRCAIILFWCLKMTYIIGISIQFICIICYMRFFLV